MNFKMKNKKLISGEAVFGIFNNTFLCVFSLLFIFPFLMLLTKSLVSEQELIRRGYLILFPQKLDFSAYSVIFSQGSLLINAYKITAFKVIVGTALSLIVTAMFAFGIAKKSLPGRKILLLFILITMFFGGGLIPTYIIVKNLGLIDSIWSLVIPNMVSAWYLIILKNYFVQIPESLEESATIDGASPFRILIRIIIPISLPVMATIGLFYAVTQWNSWFDAAIYINDYYKMPVQIIMRNIVISASKEEFINKFSDNFTVKPNPETMKAAVIIASTIPILCVYPFIQKYFIKGVIIGSIKG
jgi:ABC-type sugar transport system, permease component